MYLCLEFKCFLFVAVGPPYTLRLKVKFYSSEPNTLREELTKYQFFLQLKQDLLEGRLECTDEKAIELSALALQCMYIFNYYIFILNEVCNKSTSYLCVI